MVIGRKDYTTVDTGRVSIDDPLALEKLTIRLHELENATPRNSSKISETKKRIALLHRIDKMPHEEHTFPGGLFRTNEERNRIEFLFDQLPDQVTVKLLLQNGFRAPKNSLLYHSPRTPKYLKRAYRLSSQLNQPFSKSFTKTQQKKLLFYARTLIDALNTPISETALEKAVSKLSSLNGISFTVKGAQTSLAVIWISGDIQCHTDTLTSLGAVWSTKRSAYYIRIPQGRNTARPGSVRGGQPTKTQNIL